MYKKKSKWTAWEGLTAETAASLTTGDKTLSGKLTVSNITLSSNGKINCVDDNHYIQLDQTADTLTLQEYGKISFIIGVTKTQTALIDFTTLRILDNTIISNTTLLSSLNVSGITTFNNITTCISSLNVSGTTNLNNAASCISSLNVSSGVTTLSNDTNIIGTLHISSFILLNNFNTTKW
jgi:hypothetical protein